MANTKKKPAIEIPANFPRPLHNRVIVTATPPETQTASGLFIPDSAQENQNKGYVMAIGPKVGQEEGSVKLQPGDLVAYGEHAGSEIEIDGTPYLIIRESDILYKL